jgi:hypothetical protein
VNDVIAWNTTENLHAGIRGDFKCCAMKDPSGYCCPDRCKGQRESLLAPDLRLLDKPRCVLVKLHLTQVINPTTNMNPKWLIV